LRTIPFFCLLIFISACEREDPYASLRRQLTLNDFKAKPYVYARGLIVTDVKFKIMSVDTTHYLPYVKCIVIPETIMFSEKSFIARRGFSKQEVLLALKHEQCHYDISSLYAIEFKKRTEQILFKPKLLERQVDSVLRELRPKYDSIQKRFDMDATYVNRQIDKWAVKLKKEIEKEMRQM
jgi:hypothetical protein